MRVEYTSSLEEMSSLSVTSGEQQVMPGPKRKSKDALSKYQKIGESKQPVLAPSPEPLSRQDESFKKKKQSNNKLFDLLWKGKWQDALSCIRENPKEAQQEIQLPDFSMENNSGVPSIFINALPLHLACAMRPLPPTNLLQTLIQANPEACKKSTGSPLGLLPIHLAADLTDVRYTGEVKEKRESPPTLESRDDTTTALRKRPSKVSESPNQAEIVKLLLEICPESVLLPEQANDMLPLHIAASTAKLCKTSRCISPVSEHVLELIVEAGPPQVAVKIRDKGGKTPMDYAWSNMQCSKCQQATDQQSAVSNCQCRQNSASKTHPLLQSVIKSHLSMITPAIRETEGGFIRPPTTRRKMNSMSPTHSMRPRSRAGSASSAHSRRPSLRADDARSVGSSQSRSTTPLRAMVEHAAKTLGSRNSPRSNTPTRSIAASSSSSPRKAPQTESRDETLSTCSRGRRSTTPTKARTQNAAQDLMNTHLFLPVEEKAKIPMPEPVREREIRSSQKCLEPRQSVKTIAPPSLRSSPSISEQSVASDHSTISNKMYMKAIQSSNIRRRFKPIVPKSCSRTVSPVSASATATPGNDNDTDISRDALPFNPFGAQDSSRAFVPVQKRSEPSGRASSDGMSKAASSFSKPSPIIKTVPLSQSNTANGILCLQLRLSDLVHPGTASMGNRSTSPGGILRRSNSFGNLRKNLLPNPCFEVFLAHHAGLSKGYYKSYPLFSTVEGMWEEAFIDSGLTRRQLEYGVDGGSHVEVGIRVLHCPEKGSDMQLIGTCVISLENLERYSTAAKQTTVDERNKYPLLQGYEVKGWLQVLSFKIK